TPCSSSNESIVIENESRKFFEFCSTRVSNPRPHVRQSHLRPLSQVLSSLYEKKNTNQKDTFQRQSTYNNIKNAYLSVSPLVKLLARFKL
ncbi:hypothetical protein SFRURICE_002482, partial [Spodoptera frugiperda]